MTLALIYIRQSKESEGSVSPETQEAACRKLPDRHSPEEDHWPENQEGLCAPKRTGLPDRNGALWLLSR